MTRDPFLRVALFGCCSLYALGLVLVGVYVAVWAVAAVAGLGFLLAIAVTIELAPPDPEQRINGDDNPDRPKGFIRLPHQGGRQ